MVLHQKAHRPLRVPVSRITLHPHAHILNLPKSKPRILCKVAWEAVMPHYEFLCHNCKKLFSKILSLIDYEEGEILCPYCGSKEVEQCWSVFSAITSKKSA
jgi:putative FmdB family regulatory protein